MVSVLIAIAAFAGVALVYKLVTARPNPGFYPYPRGAEIPMHPNGASCLRAPRLGYQGATGATAA
jgi:hypothetical protein